METKLDNLDADIKAQVIFVPANVRSEHAQAVAAFAIAEKEERDARAAYEKALEVVRRSLPDSKETASRIAETRKRFAKVSRDNTAIWDAFFKRAEAASGFGINRDVVRAYVCGNKDLSLVEGGGEGCVIFQDKSNKWRCSGVMKKSVVKVIESFTPPTEPDADAAAEIESAFIKGLPDGFSESVERLIDLRKEFEKRTEGLERACDRVGVAYRNLKEAELRETYSISNALAAQERRDQEKKERIAKLRAEADKLEAESRRG